MRRKILFTVMMIVCCLGMKAQRLADLNTQRWVNVEVDFSKASIHNMDEEEFSHYEPNYARYRPEVVAKLVENFNDTEKVKFSLGRFREASYTIKVTVVSVSVKGNMMSFAEVIDKEGNVIVTISDIYGEGGTFGSKMNLMGDGCKSTGQALAKKLAKMIKKDVKLAKEK